MTRSAERSQCVQDMVQDAVLASMLELETMVIGLFSVFICVWQLL